MFNPFASFEDKDAVAVEDLHNLINNKESIIIVDVRTSDEYQTGHIEGSRLVPLPEIAESLYKLPDKSRKIFVYCRSGTRSAKAVAFLKQLGYKDIHNVKGGIIAWSKKGYKIEK